MLLVAGLTVVTLVLLVWSRQAFGARSVWFAFLVVWLPMTWLGVLSRFTQPRMPERYHALRRWERDGRLYETARRPVVQAAVASRPARGVQPGPASPCRPVHREPRAPRPADARRRGEPLRPARVDARRRPSRGRTRLVGGRRVDPAVRRPREWLPGDAATLQPEPVEQALQPGAHDSTPG